MTRELTVLLLMVVVGWCGSYTTEENHDPGGECPWGCSCSDGDNRTMVSCGENVTDIFGNLPPTTTSLEVFNTTTAAVSGNVSYGNLEDVTLVNSKVQDLTKLNISILAPHLLRLNLSSNLIFSLPNNIFASFATLQVLNLSDNSIAFIGKGCFNGLSQLQVLDLTFNKLSKLERNAFEKLSSLRSLRLGGNRLVAFSSPETGLGKTLEHLDLSFNRIADINETFQGLDSLQQVNFRGNQLTTLTNDSLQGMLRLVQLDVSQNNISNMYDNVFGQMDSLLRLNLSDNTLQTLGDSSFIGLGHLQQLDVSHNRISNVSPGTFQDLAGLVELSLADNPALGLVVLVGTGRRLQAVDASRAGLTQIPAALTRSIRTLTLAGNAVAAVRCGDVDSYPLLQVLDLSDNCITELEEDALGRLEVLSMLFLAGNKLTTVPRSLPAGLHTLHLQRNPIHTLNAGDLQGLPKLRALSLRFCEISSIQNGALSQVTGLESLDLSENPLKNLSGNALSGPSLSVLRLSRLSEVSADAAGIREMSFPVTSPERLEVLTLDYSPVLARQLLADTAALAAFRRLRELDLRHAGITRIRSDLFHFLPRLNVLRLGENPLDCDTDLKWLADWVKRHRSPKLQDAICAAPPDLLSIPLVQLSIFNEEPPENATVRYDASITVPLTAELLPTTETFSDYATASTDASELYTEDIRINDNSFAFNFHTTDQPVAQFPSSSTEFYDNFSTVFKQDNDTPFTKNYVPDSDTSKFTENVSSTDAFSGAVTATPSSNNSQASYQQLQSNSSTKNNKTATKSKQMKLKNKNTMQYKTNAQRSQNITIYNLHQSDVHPLKDKNITQTYKQKAKIAEETAKSINSNFATHKNTTKSLAVRNRTYISQTRLQPTAAVNKIHSHTLSQNSSRPSKVFDNNEHQFTQNDKPFNIMQGDESPSHMHRVSVANQSIKLELFTAKSTQRTTESKHSNITLRPKPHATKHVNSPRNASVTESYKKYVEFQTTNATKSLINHSPLLRNHSIYEINNNESVFAHKVKSGSESNRKSEKGPSVTTNVPLEGENLVLENVTLSVGDRSVFYSSRASDAFASGVRVMVKDSGVPVSGSHPGMFVLLGLGLAMAGALAMALSHCAKRRRRQAVEYSRQQDIEVRSMSSIGDLW